MTILLIIHKIIIYWHIFYFVKITLSESQLLQITANITPAYTYFFVILRHVVFRSKDITDIIWGTVSKVSFDVCSALDYGISPSDWSVPMSRITVDKDKMF